MYQGQVAKGIPDWSQTHKMSWKLDNCHKGVKSVSGIGVPMGVIRGISNTGSIVNPRCHGVYFPHRSRNSTRAGSLACWRLVVPRLRLPGRWNTGGGAVFKTQENARRRLDVEDQDFLMELIS